MKKARQIAAIIGIVLLVGMYVATLITALFASEYAHGMFMASLFSSLVVPVMIYMFMQFYKWTHKDGAVSMRKAKKLAKEADRKADEEAQKAQGQKS